MPPERPHVIVKPKYMVYCFLVCIFSFGAGRPTEQIIQKKIPALQSCFRALNLYHSSSRFEHSETSALAK